MVSLDLKLLGGFAARLGSGQPIEIAGKKNQALLAYLALNEGKKVSREKLIGLLWSDRGEAQGRNSLRQALAALRQALSGVDHSPLILEGEQVALDPASTLCDAVQFTALAKSDSADDLRRAAKLYEGQLLDGISVRDPAFEEWLSAERAILQEAAAAALGKAAEQSSGSEAVALARQALALDPLLETSHRALMRAHAAAGETAQALQHYARCRDLLKAELGVAPAQETEALRREILAGGSESEATDKPLAPPRDVAPQAISIAVMPFANLSGDPDQEYFVDGLTEDLITALSRWRHLHVLARSSTFQYKNRQTGAQQVGRELGARYLVEGSVRRSGERIRVTAQLIDRDSGAHLWAERFDRHLADVFIVQDQIVHAVSAQLGMTLIDVAVASDQRTDIRNLTAYDYFLRGRAAWLRGAVIETRDNHLKAVETDPNYGAALAALAFFYSEDMFMQMSGESVEELARLAQLYADRAIVCGEVDSFIHIQVGTAMFSLGKLPEAQHHLELALSLNPYHISAAINLGVTIVFSGRHEEGLAMIERAFQLEPRLPPAMRAVPFWVHCLLGNPEAAKSAMLKIGRTLAYEHLLMAVCLAGAGRGEEAQFHAKTFEAARSPWFDVAGFTRCFRKIPALPEDRERFLGGIRRLGYQV